MNTDTKPKDLEYQKIEDQLWTGDLDIEIPGSVVHNNRRYYTWDQAIELEKKVKELYGDQWQLPTREDFIRLAEHYDYDGKKMVDDGWVLGGRVNDDGSFYGATSFGYCWSSSYYNTAWAYYLFFSSDGIVYPQYNFNKYFGFAVRCLRNLADED